MGDGLCVPGGRREGQEGCSSGEGGLMGTELERRAPRGLWRSLTNEEKMDRLVRFGNRFYPGIRKFNLVLVLILALGLVKGGWSWSVGVALVMALANVFLWPSPATMKKLQEERGS